MLSDIVENIVDTMSINEFEDYLRTADYYAVHSIRDYQIKIKNCPYANLHKHNHINKFKNIEKILNSKIDTKSFYKKLLHK